MFLDLELLEKQSLHLNWLAQSRVSLINGPKCEKKNPGGGVDTLNVSCYVGWTHYLLFTPKEYQEYQA